MATTMLKLILFKILIICGMSGLLKANYTTKAENYFSLVSLYMNGTTSLIDVIPLVNQSSSMNVKANVLLYSLNEFDEVSGNIELAVSLNLSWTDEIVNASTGLNNTAYFTIDAGGTRFQNSIVVKYTDIWTPTIVLYNSLDSYSSIGDTAFRCRFFLESGLVVWQPKFLLNSACSPDVTYYPFDRQTCLFTFVHWGSTADEIVFQNDKYEWDMSDYEENGEWRVIETTSESVSISGTNGDQSQLKLTIIIERKALYYAFNIILPVLVLCVLNGMVFWLPVESGERIGFSITCFLSFVVLLNMIMDFLPRTSSPMSYLCYYLVIMMICSGLMTALVIIQMRLTQKPDTQPVPKWLQKIYRILTLDYFTKPKPKRKNVVSDQVESIWDDPNDENGENIDIEKSTETKESQNEDTDVKDISWKEVGLILDKFLFLCFLAGQSLFSVTFLVPLGYRAT